MQQSGVSHAVGDEIDAVVGDYVVEHASHRVVEGDVGCVGGHFHLEQFMALGPKDDVYGFAFQVFALDGVLLGLIAHMRKAEPVARLGVSESETALFIGDGYQKRVVVINTYIFDGSALLVDAHPLEVGLILGVHHNREKQEEDR